MIHWYWCNFSELLLKLKKGSKLAFRHLKLYKEVIFYLKQCEVDYFEYFVPDTLILTNFSQMLLKLKKESKVAFNHVYGEIILYVSQSE